MFLLGELLRKGGINREEYTQCSNILAESLGSGIELAEEDKTEDETREVKLKKLIQSKILLDDIVQIHHGVQTFLMQMARKPSLLNN